MLTESVQTEVEMCVGSARRGHKKAEAGTWHVIRTVGSDTSSSAQRGGFILVSRSVS